MGTPGLSSQILQLWLASAFHLKSCNFCRPCSHIHQLFSYRHHILNNHDGHLFVSRPQNSLLGLSPFINLILSEMGTPSIWVAWERLWRHSLLVGQNASWCSSELLLNPIIYKCGSSIIDCTSTWKPLFLCFRHWSCELQGHTALLRGTTSNHDFLFQNGHAKLTSDPVTH